MSFVPSDWRVRVFRSSGHVDRPFELLSERTIHLSGIVHRRLHYRGGCMHNTYEIRSTINVQGVFLDFAGNSCAQKPNKA